MDNSKKIFLASDHNGNAARAYILKFLSKEYYVVDLGPFEYDGKVDYIDYASKLCNELELNPGARGILICGTGTGMCIVANRYSHIRAALVTDRATAELSREHNDANVLVLGQWRTPLGSMDEIINTWLNTPFSEGRHVARLKKLEEAFKK